MEQQQSQDQAQISELHEGDFYEQAEQEVMRIREEIRMQGHIREQLENKIYEQFGKQISDLHDLFDEERKQRELKEEQLVSFLRSIY